MIKRLLICCSFFIWITGDLFAQTTDIISVSFEDANLETILDSISSASGYFFSYNTEVMPDGSLFTIEREGIKIEDLLDELFVGTYLKYTFMGDQIILRQVIRGSEGGKRQYTKIKGWVRDAETMEPVFGAHVYINGSTVGTYTDQWGNYELNNLHPGNYQVVFSHVGYEPAAYEINSTLPASYAINALLNIATNVLDGVEVKSMPLVDDENWIKYYRQFIDEFIGNSYNSSKCTLKNPEIIEFSHMDSLDTYEAVIEEPLKMENRGLGYDVVFEVDYFISNSRETKFHVRASFDELQPENHRIKKRWKKNRERSYNGSTFHFFRTLLNAKLKPEGYYIYLTTDIDDRSKYQGGITLDDLISESNGRYYLRFENYLVVEYNKEIQHPEYLKPFGDDNRGYAIFLGSADVTSSKHQISAITLKQDSVRVLKNGQVNNPEDIQYFGYWSWERMSELMPVDYDLKSE